MAYNRKNKLKIIEKVNEIYLREKRDGVSTAYIFRTYIEPTYPMSMATFYNYLATPYAKELKVIENQEK